MTFSESKDDVASKLVRVATLVTVPAQPNSTCIPQLIPLIEAVLKLPDRGNGEIKFAMFGQTAEQT